MTANTTTAALDAIIAGQIHELEQLPGANRLEPASQATLYAMACAMLQAGQWQQASAYLSFLLLYAPTHPDYLRTKAQCALRADNPIQATQLLSLALYVQPESCAIALALAEALIEADAPQAARVLLQQLQRLAQLPADLTEHTRAGLMLQALASHAAA
jgi:predicted Zn-dependent protease